MKKVFFIFFLFLGQYVHATDSEFTVITFNTAQARALGHDFNPCVKQRLDAIEKFVLKKETKPTVYLFQELFYQNAYERLERWAKSNQFNITETSSQLNGLVVLTNLPLKQESFKGFSCNNNFQKLGMLSVFTELNGTPFKITNSHTLYSKANSPDRCHKAHLKELATFANLSSLPSVVAGDFNIGPDMVFIGQKYDMAKMWDPFIHLLGPRWTRFPSEKLGVTWDINNPLTMPYKKDDEAREISHLNSTLDHIFVDQKLEIVSTEIVYSEPVEVRNCPLYETAPNQSFLSDHYGLKSVIRLRQP